MTTRMLVLTPWPQLMVLGRGTGMPARRLWQQQMLLLTTSPAQQQDLASRRAACCL